MTQPAPIPNDNDSIHDLVCDFVTHSPDFSTAEKLRLIEGFKQRKDIGIERYGTVLQAHNGRDFSVDAYEEIFDFVVYWRGKLEEDGATEETLEIYIDSLRLASRVALCMFRKRDIQRVKDRLKPLSQEEIDRSKPTVPPDILANALQDTVYVSTGKSRPAKCKRAPKNKEGK